MKYEKNQYSEGASICALIIAGVFLFWGINNLIIDPFFRLVGVNWWGFIWLGIAVAIIASQVGKWVNRDKLRKAVLYEYEEHPNATIEEIRRNTGISRRDIQAIVLDLKARGLLRGKFSSETGELKHTEVVTKEEKMVTGDEVSYCPNCGTAKSKESAVFCSYCGTKLD